MKAFSYIIWHIIGLFGLLCTAPGILPINLNPFVSGVIGGVWLLICIAIARSKYRK